MERERCDVPRRSTLVSRRKQMALEFGCSVVTIGRASRFRDRPHAARRARARAVRVAVALRCPASAVRVHPTSHPGRYLAELWTPTQGSGALLGYWGHYKPTYCCRRPKTRGVKG